MNKLYCFFFFKEKTSNEKPTYLKSRCLAFRRGLGLDEPLAGTDPLSRSRIVALIKERARGANGKCILVSSHVLHEVEAMTENILLLARGQLVASGTVHAIREMLDEFPHHIRVRCDRPRDLGKALV